LQAFALLPTTSKVTAFRDARSGPVHGNWGNPTRHGDVFLAGGADAHQGSTGTQVAHWARQGAEDSACDSPRGATDDDPPVDPPLSDEAAAHAFPRVWKQLYSDTLFAKTKSLRMHMCAQAFNNGTAYTKFYPMKSKKEAGERLERLITEL
jgi:hypothetical protein